MIRTICFRIKNKKEFFWNKPNFLKYKNNFLGFYRVPAKPIISYGFFNVAVPQKFLCKEKTTFTQRYR